MSDFAARLMREIGHDELHMRAEAFATHALAARHMVSTARPRAVSARAVVDDPATAADEAPPTALQGGDRPWRAGRLAGAIPTA